MNRTIKFFLIFISAIVGSLIAGNRQVMAASFDCNIPAGPDVKNVGQPCGVTNASKVPLYCSTNGGTGKVDMICTTNEYNFCPTNVCLLRIGDGPCMDDWQCEGGAICVDSTCEIDTGDTSLGGTLGTASDIRDTVRRFINIGLGFLGVLVVLMIIYGGAMWLTSSGSEDKVTKGKHILVWAAIGAIVISIAWTISSYVLKVGRVLG